tara:strand:- start:324 stop:620 length:297 start_codon:yes stop_codon:yes gene_type:complete
MEKSKEPKSPTKKRKESSDSKAADVRGNRFDKKFKKYASSHESQLHAKDFDEGVDRAEKRAMKEVLFDSGYIDDIKRLKGGGIAQRGLGRAFKKGGKA